MASIESATVAAIRTGREARTIASIIDSFMAILLFLKF